MLKNNIFNELVYFFLILEILIIFVKQRDSEFTYYSSYTHLIFHSSLTKEDTEDQTLLCVDFKQRKLTNIIFQNKNQESFGKITIAKNL